MLFPECVTKYKVTAVFPKRCKCAHTHYFPSIFMIQHLHHRVLLAAKPCTQNWPDQIRPMLFTDLGQRVAEGRRILLPPYAALLQLQGSKEGRGDSWDGVAVLFRDFDTKARAGFSRDLGASSLPSMARQHIVLSHLSDNLRETFEMFHPIQRQGGQD